MLSIKLLLTKLSDQNKGILKITGPDEKSKSGEFSLPWAENEWPVIYKVLSSNQIEQTILSGDEIDIAIKLSICNERGRLRDGFLEQLGYQLYQSIFAEEDVRNLFSELVSKLGNVVELHVPDVGSYLLSYPWEALNDGKYFLFLTRHHILRWIDFEEPVPHQRVQDREPLVLVIDPRPHSVPEDESLPRTDFRIINSILNSQVLNQHKNLIDNGATLAAIDSILSFEETVSILHIDTHGDFGWLCACGKLNTDADNRCSKCETARPDKLRSQGYLFFQDKDGKEEWVSGEKLGRQLDGKNISLVVLNTCKSGTIGGSSAFNSLAGALIKYNIPVVVGFQTRITIPESEYFSERFYRKMLLKGSPIEAVTDARQILHSFRSENSWIRPVIYYRSNPPEDSKTRMFQALRLNVQVDIKLHPNPNRNTWLKELEFKLDPFSGWRGIRDENITKYFLPFPKERFFDVRDNEPVFLVLGENGTGKSSLRKALSLFVLEEDAGLPVTYDDLHELDIVDISLEKHASKLISHLFASLYKYLQDKTIISGKEQFELKLDERNRLWAYIDDYLNDQTMKDWFRRWLNPIGEETPMIEVENTAVDDFKESCRFIRQFVELPTIWLLIDPEDDRFENDEHVWKIIEPLLVDYRDLLDSFGVSTSVRFFLPEQFEAKLYDLPWFKNVGPQCLVYLKWDEPSLINLLRTRIWNCSNGRYESIGQISEDIQADETIARASRNKPRYLIWICDELFRQHCATEELAKRKNITQAEIERSIESVVDKINEIENRQKNISEIEEFIQNGESQILELKSTMRWDIKAGRRNPEMDKEIAQAIAAFLNTEGGTLVIGVGDHGESIGIVHDLKTLNRKNQTEGGFRDAFIDGVLRNLLGLKPEAIIEITKTMSFENYRGRKVFIAKIKRSDKAIFVNDEFYIRQGSISQKLSTSEALDYIREHFDKN